MTDTPRRWDRLTAESDPAFEALAAYLETGSPAGRVPARLRQRPRRARGQDGVPNTNWVSRRAAFVACEIHAGTCPIFSHPPKQAHRRGPLRIASAERRVKPLARLLPLRYGPAGDRLSHGGGSQRFPLWSCWGGAWENGPNGLEEAWSVEANTKDDDSEV